MAVHKRTEITVETDEVLVVRRTRVCPACCPFFQRGEVDIVRVGDARSMASTPVNDEGPRIKVATKPAPYPRLGFCDRGGDLDLEKGHD